MARVSSEVVRRSLDSLTDMVAAQTPQINFFSSEKRRFNSVTLEYDPHNYLVSHLLLVVSIAMDLTALLQFQKPEHQSFGCDFILPKQDHPSIQTAHVPAVTPTRDRKRAILYCL